MDRQYRQLDYSPSEMQHEYGEGVHILQDPVGLSQLARLCSPRVGQPEFNRLIRRLYQRMVSVVANVEFPRRDAEVPSRMQEFTDRGVYAGEIVDPQTSVVTVDIARAGIVPSEVCFGELNELLAPEVVRQDHLIMSRVADEEGNVVGVEINGEKVGGSVDDRIVLFPDPMGATGSSLSRALQYYKDEVGGEARRLVTMNLIVTPEFIRRISEDHPEALIYTMRLDRGMSPPEVLETVPGTHWEEESGLNERDYIVPGGGGFGELMNNSWV